MRRALLYSLPSRLPLPAATISPSRPRPDRATGTDRGRGEPLLRHHDNGRRVVDHDRQGRLPAGRHGALHGIRLAAGGRAGHRAHGRSADARAAYLVGERRGRRDVPRLDLCRGRGGPQRGVHVGRDEQGDGAEPHSNFTDSNPGVPTLSAQSPNPAISGLTATYTVTVPFGGNNQPCTVSLSATPVTPPNWPSPPPGGFFSFSPATVRGTGGTQTSTLTITLPAGMAANTYRFSVTSTHAPITGDTCNGNAVSTTNPINLVIAANQPANTPATLAQFRSDATTTLATGGSTNETSVVLKAGVSDPDAGNTVKLQVEVKPVGTPFTNGRAPSLASSPAEAPHRQR